MCDTGKHLKKKKIPESMIAASVRWPLGVVPSPALFLQAAGDGE